MGIKLINLTSFHMMQTQNVKIMAKFSAMPVYRAMIKNPHWAFLGEKRLMGKMQYGGSMDRKTGFRECGIKTYHFEFICDSPKN